MVVKARRVKKDVRRLIRLGPIRLAVDITHIDEHPLIMRLARNGYPIVKSRRRGKRYLIIDDISILYKITEAITNS